MLQIMQHSLSVTTNGHLNNRQVIRHGQPQFCISWARCITSPEYKGEAWVRNQALNGCQNTDTTICVSRSMTH
jgi:hypothetical protein